MCELLRRGRRGSRQSARSRSSAGARPTRWIPCEPYMQATPTSADLHPRSRHRQHAARLARARQGCSSWPISRWPRAPAPTASDVLETVEVLAGGAGRSGDRRRARSGSCRCRRSRSPPRWCASAWPRGPVEELVGAAVAGYIAEHGLYRRGRSGGLMEGEQLGRGDRPLRGRQEGDRCRRARPARGARLHRLLPRLLGQHRPPGEGDPRRHPRGAQARARPAAPPRRGIGAARAGS